MDIVSPSETPTGSGGGIGDSGSGGGGARSDAGTDAALFCQQPPPLPQGSQGPSSCACPCANEAPAILWQLAQRAIDAHDTNGVYCKTAWGPMPTSPPMGKCFQPTVAPYFDFNTGDATSGWSCIGASSIPALNGVIRCSYFYAAGSDYVGPALGGPDPGPTGFEVSAQGDFDGDGVYSTFTITGKVDPVTNQISLSPLFVHDPDE